MTDTKPSIQLIMTRTGSTLVLDTPTGTTVIATPSAMPRSITRIPTGYSFTIVNPCKLMVKATRILVEIRTPEPEIIGTETSSTTSSMQLVGIGPPITTTTGPQSKLLTTTVAPVIVPVPMTDPVELSS